MKSITKYILTFLLAVAISPAMPLRAKEEIKKDFVVVIDAGHGGKDLGAVDNGIREKDINLAVAKQLKLLIDKKLKNTKVVMTREGDTYLTLQERADKANRSKGDLFISIHTNSVDKKNRNRRSIAGSSVYALGLHRDESNKQVAMRENSVIELENNYEQKYSGFDPNKDESYIIFEMAQKNNLSKSIKFAEETQKQMVGSGRNDRGVHQAGFWVLWATSMPSALVELDFICNPESAKYLGSSKGQKELASAICKAVEKFHAGWKGQTNVSNDDNRQLNEKIEEIEEDVVPEFFSENPTHVVLLASKSTGRKASIVPADNTRVRRPDTISRKRRSIAARQKSSSRSFETDVIPLHSESERLGLVSPYIESKEESNITASVGSSKESSQKNTGKSKKKVKEKVVKEEKKKRPTNAHNAKIEKFVTVYKIQILASSELLNQNNPRFCGLKPVTAYRDNNLYKYYYGESSDKNVIDGMLAEVRKKIPDAFIVKSMKSESSKN